MLRRSWLAAMLFQQIHRALGDGKIAGTENHNRPVALLDEAAHFFKTGNLIDAGVSAGVGGEQHACVQLQGDTISHNGFSSDVETC